MYYLPIYEEGKCTNKEKCRKIFITEKYVVWLRFEYQKIESLFRCAYVCTYIFILQRKEILDEVYWVRQSTFY